MAFVDRETVEVRRYVDLDSWHDDDAGDADS
jgi:hypothetical protein